MTTPELHDAFAHAVEAYSGRARWSGSGPVTAIIERHLAFAVRDWAERGFLSAETIDSLNWLLSQQWASMGRGYSLVLAALEIARAGCDEARVRELLADAEGAQLDRLALAFARADRCLAYRVTLLCARPDYLNALRELAAELGLAVPQLPAPTGATFLDAQVLAADVVELVERAHLSPETRDRVEVHLQQLRALSVHTTRVAGTRADQEATP